MKKYKEQLHNNIDGGLAHNMNPQDIADKHKVDISVILTQLEKGIEVEYEHTYNTEIAKEIAMDHLVEYPYYYDELEKMEKKFENIKGNKMERYTRKFKEDAEEDKSLEAIKDLIDTKWSGSNEEQGKAVALLRGLAFSDTDVSNKFMKELDGFTSGLKIDKFEEGCKKGKGGKKKGLSENKEALNWAVKLSKKFKVDHNNPALLTYINDVLEQAQYTKSRLRPNDDIYRKIKDACSNIVDRTPREYWKPLQYLCHVIAGG